MMMLAAYIIKKKKLSFFLQDAEEHISSKEVLLNTYPVTLINVDEKLVYQTIFASVHAIKRRDNLKTEGSMLLHGTELNEFKTR